MAEQKTEKKEKTFTAKQVLNILDLQRKACADSITAESLTGFEARRRILETDPVEF